MSSDDLKTHLKTGATTVCRAWSITRRDGVVLGFTDHDRDLEFDGKLFRSNWGFAARAVEQTTGLSVDNTEVVGVLSDPAIREEDIALGRFDRAEVLIWQVNWVAPQMRRLIFRGSLGEIERTGRAFRAELRGLADQLQVPGGRAYQKPCSAVLGDASCKVDLSDPGFSSEAQVVAIERGTELTLPEQVHPEGWFAGGRLRVLDGVASGVAGIVKRDRSVAGQRVIELWETISAGFGPGDLVRIEAGCDKRMATCREKFDNMLNYRGFPDIPGDDWLVSYPTRRGSNDGGSLRR